MNARTYLVTTPADGTYRASLWDILSTFATDPELLLEVSGLALGHAAELGETRIAYVGPSRKSASCFSCECGPEACEEHDGSAPAVDAVEPEAPRARTQRQIGRDREIGKAWTKRAARTAPRRFGR